MDLNNQISEDKQYVQDGDKSVGIALIYKDSILLTKHPSEDDFINTLSIPKGRQEVHEEGQDYLTAHREVKEEVGIDIPLTWLIDAPKYELTTSDNRTVYYYVIEIDDLRKIELNSTLVSPNQYQKEEVDYACFLPFNLAQKYIRQDQKDILAKCGYEVHSDGGSIHHTNIVKATDSEGYVRTVIMNEDLSTDGHGKIFQYFINKGIEIVDSEYVEIPIFVGESDFIKAFKIFFESQTGEQVDDENPSFIRYNKDTNEILEADIETLSGRKYKYVSKDMKFYQYEPVNIGWTDESPETMKRGGVVRWKHKYNDKYGYDKDESHSLEDISKKTGVSMEGLQQIYNKGVGSFKTNPESVRPNVKSKEQWAMARVYSAVMGGESAKVDANELKMKEGGEASIKYQFRDIDGVIAYYKQVNGGAWEFIRKEEFDENANNLTIVLYSSKSPLEEGTEIEMEHKDTIEKLTSGDYSVEEGAKMIAQDHLDERGDYYEVLKEQNLEEGGIIEGQLHSECNEPHGCGEKFEVGDSGKVIEAERDEAVIVSDTFDKDISCPMDGCKYRMVGTLSQIASGLNVLGGGKAFDKGAKVFNEDGKRLENIESKPESKNTDVDKKIESGSIIINRRSMADKKIYEASGTPRQIASVINSINGNGVVIEDGGSIKQA